MKNNLINKKFNNLLVEKKSYTRNNNVYWECLCDCGKTTFVSTANLNNNRTKSCGCLKINILLERSTKHRQRHTKLYEVWKSIKQRCLNPKNKAYHNYGGRGITIFSEWINSYESFYNWSLTNGYKEGLSIDRINVNGNYEPNNCRWTTRKVQCNNTRVNKYFTINNETKSLSDWCRIYNIKYSTVAERLYYNWDIIKALTTPIKCRKSS